MRNPHVTATGRAKSEGRVTRASRLVRTRQRGQEQPLPFALTCHPKRLAPTAVHPECDSDRRWRGKGLELSRKLKKIAFITGAGLSKEPGKVRLVWGANTRYCNDINYATAWRYAAKKHHIIVKVYYPCGA